MSKEEKIAAPILHTRCDQKVAVILEFRELCLFDFRIFLLSWYTCLLYMLTTSAILDCQFVFDR